MTNHPMPGTRVVVIGTTGAGKTTLARQLATRLGCPHVELDALHWEAGWMEAPLAVFRERVSQATAGERWVVDGSYGKVQATLWPAADTIVWLDYSLPLILWRLTRRTLRRVFTREELWNGNRERFADQFLSRDSLFLWLLKTYNRKRRQFPEAFRRPEHAHLRIIQLRSPRETAAWLAAVNGIAESTAD